MLWATYLSLYSPTHSGEEPNSGCVEKV